MSDNYAAEVNSLHEKAMNLAEEAFLLKRQNKHAEALEKNKSAFLVEKSIADYLIKLEPHIEPSRSIICSSSAFLAESAGLNESDNYYAQKVIEYNIDGKLVAEAKELLEKLK